jgi:hypothetical protein
MLLRANVAERDGDDPAARRLASEAAVLFARQGMSLGAAIGDQHGATTPTVADQARHDVSQTALCTIYMPAFPNPVVG